MPRLLMFDIDGTLTATDEVDTACYIQAISEHLGIAIDSDWSRYCHVTDSGIAAELFALHHRSREELPNLRRRFIELIERALQTNPRCCGEVPGAAEFLVRVRRTPGWIVGLATGGWSGSAKAKLRQAGIEFEGLAFASADDAEARIEIMRICRQRAEAGEAVTEVVYVGDGVWDAQASKTLGWRFIGIGETLHAVRLRESATYPVFLDFSDPDAVLHAAVAG